MGISSLPRFDRGIHLCELLAALCIVGILVFASAPHLADLRRSARLTAEARAFAATLEHCGAAAVRTGAAVVLTVESTGWRAEHGERLLENHRLPAGVTIEMPVSSVTRITCYPSGAATPRTFVLACGSTTRRVALSLRGRVTVV